jgi:hypothetical protein
VLEHRTSKPGRWLRENRLRIALLVAVVEGAAIAFGVLSGWIAIAIGLAVVGFYFFVGRRLLSNTFREASWTAALSQVLVMLVPLLLFVVGTLVILAVGIIAVLALVALFADRR